jgi:hypothetical protein
VGAVSTAGLTRSVIALEPYSQACIRMVSHFPTYHAASIENDVLIILGTYKQYVKSPERYTTLIPDGVHDYVAGVGYSLSYINPIHKANEVSSQSCAQQAQYTPPLNPLAFAQANSQSSPVAAEALEFKVCN